MTIVFAAIIIGDYLLGLGLSVKLREPGGAERRRLLNGKSKRETKGRNTEPPPGPTGIYGYVTFIIHYFLILDIGCEESD